MVIILSYLRVLIIINKSFSVKYKICSLCVCAHTNYVRNVRGFKECECEIVRGCEERNVIVWDIKIRDAECEV